jgi:glucosyl-dolichyl phosphate glucuronosyltransferase
VRIDILIATYNREALLRKTLDSIAKATKPPNLDVGVIVIDNNSTDATPQAVRDFASIFGQRLRYLFEKRQGRSAALNAGIKFSNAQLVATIDDDEQIAADWLVEVARQFNDPKLDFLGGACHPDWGGRKNPNWLPSSHRALIGWIIQSEQSFNYSLTSPGYLVGGNAVMRRSVFDRVGFYNTDLGRTKRATDGGEDLEFFMRLIQAGLRGTYSPELIIYHYIPAKRLERSFFRSRSFWDGVSLGYISRSMPEPVPHIVGVPRYFYRIVLSGLASGTFNAFGDPAAFFAAELRLRELFGRWYGRYFHHKSESAPAPAIP